MLFLLLFQAQNIKAFMELLAQLFRWLHPLFLQLKGRRAKQQSVTPAPNPAPKNRFHNLPPAPPGFVARTAELQKLTLDLAPEGAQVVIHGMPGVGKTTLALRYAHSSSADFPGGAWWLDASDGFAPMAGGFVSELEARIPGLGPVEGPKLDARLRRCFDHWPGAETEAVLLVVDNLPPGEAGAMVRHWMTTGMRGRFRFLFIQRALPAHGVEALKLPVLASAHALELFKNRSGETGPQRIALEEGQAQALVEQVGRLPLALVLLGGRLQRVPTLTVTGLREDLFQSALAAKAFSDQNAAFLGEQGLIATLLSSWSTLGLDAMELARLLSLTLPAPIPWELIQHCEPLATGQLTGQGWDDALAELREANLLDSLEAERTLYALHPLVREFFGLQRQGWQQDQEQKRRLDLSAAAKSLASQWQAKVLVIAVDYWRQACSADASDIWAACGLGYGLLPLGDSDGAKQAFELCRRNAELAKDDHGLYFAWIGIGDVLVSQGDGSGALAAYQAGLTIREGLAKRDPANTEWQRDLSVSHDRIGDVRLSQGDGPGALAAFQAALPTSEGLAKRDPANTEWQRD
ncbi:MAG: hypothetical protein ACKN89_05790, partial [Cyanobium sp.]